jgi:hypothetical protein
VPPYKPVGVPLNGLVVDRKEAGQRPPLGGHVGNGLAGKKKRGARGCHFA